MGIFDKLKRSQKTKEQGQPAKTVSASAPKQTEKKADQAPKTTAKKASDKKAKAVALKEDVLIAPMLTEKSFSLQQKNQYCFYINTGANKQQVKSAVKHLYGIQPLSVNIVRIRPQKQYRWGRQVGRSSAKKKAIVTMPEGTVLNLTD